MTNTILRSCVTECACARADNLADRLEKGARALATFANTLTNAQWRTRVPRDGRTIGVIVHHVASVYPLEIELAQTLAVGQPITGVTTEDVDAMNARHAKEHSAVTKEATLDYFPATAARPQPPFGRSATRPWRRPPRCPCTEMRR